MLKEAVTGNSNSGGSEHGVGGSSQKSGRAVLGGRKSAAWRGGAPTAGAHGCT